MEIPATRYALHRGQCIAYQTVGQGPLDLVYCGALVSHIDMMWDIPEVERLLKRMASFCRLILLDRRGIGISDPLPQGQDQLGPEWCADILAVLDAVGSRQTAILAECEAGRIGLEFASRHPDRVSKLILSNATARFARAEDYPCGEDPAKAEGLLKAIRQFWGTEQMVRLAMPQRASDTSFTLRAARFQRASATPRTAETQFASGFAADVRPLLPDIRCPVLLLHRKQYPFLNAAAHATYMQQHLRDARCVELEGAEAMLSFDRSDAALGYIEEFLTGMRARIYSERVVKTVLFTDMVGSTQLVLKKGDSDWRNLVATFQQQVRAQIKRFNGCEVDAAGDGFFAIFDSPTAALHAAVAIREAALRLEVQMRSGLHAGECELDGDTVRGLTVHIGARVMGEAAAGEILVSRTLRDLVFGSGLEFDRRGEHELKGVPGRWRLYALRDS